MAVQLPATTCSSIASDVDEKRDSRSQRGANARANLKKLTSSSSETDDTAVLNAAWIQADTGLQAWLPEISARHRNFVHALETICSLEGSLHNFCFAHGLDRFGLQRGIGGTWYREWAPAALNVSLGR